MLRYSKTSLVSLKICVSLNLPLNRLIDIKGDKAPINNWLKDIYPPSFKSLMTNIGKLFLSKRSTNFLIVF